MHHRQPRLFFDNHQGEMATRYLSGRLALANNQVAEAITIFRMVIKEEPRLTVAHYALGQAYLQNNLPQLAKTAFSEAINIKADFVDAHIALGRVYLQSKAFDEAMTEGQTVLRLRPHELRGRLIVAISP